MVASKSVSALGILSKGMQLYQPGGLAERSAILSSLESPTEATTVSSAISTLRKWLSWKRRAEELKVGLPDPTILVRGEAHFARDARSEFQVVVGEKYPHDRHGSLA